MNYPCQSGNSRQTNTAIQNDTDHCLSEACRKLQYVCVTPRNVMVRCHGEDPKVKCACVNSANNNYSSNFIYPTRRYHHNFYDSWQDRNNSNQMKSLLNWNDDDCETSQSNRAWSSRTAKCSDRISEWLPKNSSFILKNKPLHNTPKVKFKKVLVSNKKYKRNDNTDSVNKSNERVGHVPKCYCNNFSKNCKCYLNDDLHSDKSFSVSRVQQEYERLNSKYDNIATRSSEKSLQDPLAERNSNTSLTIDSASLENIRDFRNKYFFECHSAKNKLNLKVNVLSEPHKRCQHEFYLNDNDTVVPVNKDHKNNSRCCECYLPLGKTKSSKSLSSEKKTNHSRNEQSSSSSSKNSTTSRKFIRLRVNSDCSSSELSDNDSNEPEMYIKIPVTEDMLISDKKYCLKNYRGNKMRRVRLQACDNFNLVKKRK